VFPRARTEKNEGSRKKEFEGGLVRERVRETESSRVFLSSFEEADEKRLERKAKDSSKDLREPEG
jgi:hypothetical protein